jgi:hypothetical protein
MAHRDSIIHSLPLNYGRNKQFREIRSKIHSLLDVALVIDESNFDPLSVLSTDQLRELDSEKRGKIARELSDGVRTIRSPGLVAEWFNLAILEGIEAGTINRESELLWHRHQTEESEEV